MKKVFTLILMCIFVITTYAQAPEKISYQAVIRNNSEILVVDTQVGLQITILQGTIDGTPVYVETQSPFTNSNGLVTIEIGTGDSVDDFTLINWTDGPYFIKTETDLDGGDVYTISGTSQILSAPYALHSKTAEALTGAITYTETDPVYSSSQAANITSEHIGNLDNLSGTNTGNQDISGIAINASDIADIQSEQFVQNDAIALNTAKIGITTEQSDDITANTTSIIEIENRQRLKTIQTGSFPIAIYNSDIDVGLSLVMQGRGRDVLCIVSLNIDNTANAFPSDVNLVIKLWKDGVVQLEETVVLSENTRQIVTLQWIEFDVTDGATPTFDVTVNSNNLIDVQDRYIYLIEL